MISQIDAAIYILDCMPNLHHTPHQKLIDLICSEVRYLREKQPNTPILLTDHLGYEELLP